MAGKTRVGELAKELGIAPKLIIDQLEAMGYKEKTSSSAIDDALMPRLRAALEDKAAVFAQRETERLEAARAAALRTKIEAAKAAAAKAARARTRKKAEGAAKPKPEKAKAPARGKGTAKAAEKPAVAAKVPEKVSAAKVEERVLRPAGEKAEPLVPAAAAPSPPRARR